MNENHSDDPAQLMQNIVKEVMEQLEDQYHLVPKNSAAHKRNWGADLKSKKRNHKHLHHHSNNVDDVYGRRQLKKKRRREQYSDSSASSLDDLIGPSTSSPKYPGKMKRFSLCVTPSIYYDSIKMSLFLFMKISLF